MKIDLSQFRETFFEEASEHLTTMEIGLLRLESAPTDEELVNEVFRAAHSIKGGSVALGLNEVTEVTHLLETLLDRIRAWKLKATGVLVDVLLRARDVVARLVAAAHTGCPVPPEKAAICSELQQIIEVAEAHRRDSGDSTNPTDQTAMTPATPCPADPGETIGLFADEAPTAAPEPAAEEWVPANPELLAGFCPEAEEHLDAVDRLLLTLDSNPTCKETLNAVYRAFHSIKGVASMFDLKAIVSLAHLAEDLLNYAREGTVVLTGHYLDLVFASADGLKRQVGYLQNWLASGGKLETDAGMTKLLAQLKAAMPGAQQPQPHQQPTGSNHAQMPIIGEAPPAAADHPEVERPVEQKPAAEKETVRVDRSRLDKLINSIGELVIAQSMVQQEIDEHVQHTGFHSRALPELCKIARDLQELSLSLRMVPLQNTFQKVARIVRDLSKKIAKPVHLTMHGEDTELDKTVVDRLGDPLVHMVRNAVDHGIEPPAVRIATGKPPEGNVSLKAYHQGGNVVIELADDGKGLDRQAILAKALQRGLIQEGQTLSDSEVFSLIFEPGFSTAKVVTDVSGRGVGMDVVRRNVEALQGSIHIRSQQGKGTTFTVRLPLTLAIMDGLSVSLVDDVYILPLLSVIESFQVKPEDIHKVAGAAEVVVVRGEAVPLLRLYQLLGRPSRVTDPRKGLVVLVENQGKKYALLVDELLGQLQVVMKSLDVNFQKVEGIAGATILGDGRVAMILDVFGLTRLACPPGSRARSGDALVGIG